MIRRCAIPLALLAASLVVPGCLSPAQHRGEADDVAYAIIAQQQQEALGRTEPLTLDRPADTLRRRLLLDQKLPHSGAASRDARDVEPIEQWPDAAYLDTASDTEQPITVSGAEPVRLSLVEALQVAARSSREYQSQKEQVYLAALSLDLERDAFRHTWAGMVSTLFSTSLAGEDDLSGVDHTDALSVSRRFKSGAELTALIAVDLVRLLSNERSSSLGLGFDTSLSIPLLRGSGKFVVTEPLTQAQRNVVYAIHSFERFKRTFAVQVASDYLSVLQQLDQLHNARANYERVIASTRRARRLADAGRLPEIQVDQARQDELRARDRWVGAQMSYARALDGFKTSLGLPTDALVELDPDALERLADATRAALGDLEQVAAEPESVPADEPIEVIEAGRGTPGPFEMAYDDAIVLALRHRLDLRTQVGRVFDAQRNTAIAADDLRADLTLLGSASMGERRSLGSAGSRNADLRPEKGSYSVLLDLDLPLERTAERNRYRASLIDFDRAVRDVQDLEDRIKLQVRDNLRALLQSRESLGIQAEAVKVAQRRVESTDLFLQAGRAEIRDVLEAQEALVSAQNALSSALVRYRIAELELQRDLGLLEVNEQGLWREYDPKEIDDGNDN